LTNLYFSILEKLPTIFRKHFFKRDQKNKYETRLSDAKTGVFLDHKVHWIIRRSIKNITLAVLFSYMRCTGLQGALNESKLT